MTWHTSRVVLRRSYESSVLRSVCEFGIAVHRASSGAEVRLVRLQFCVYAVTTRLKGGDYDPRGHGRARDSQGKNLKDLKNLKHTNLRFLRSLVLLRFLDQARIVYARNSEFVAMEGSSLFRRGTRGRMLGVSGALGPVRRDRGMKDQEWWIVDV